MRIVYTVDDSVEPERAAEVVHVGATVDDALVRVQLGLGQVRKHAQLNDVSRANVGNVELSLFLDALALLTVNVIQESLAEVHRWSRKPRRPVILRIVPLGQTFLLLILWVVALMRDMMRVVADLGKDRSLFAFQVDLFGL